jgi:hypothetical protein
VLEADVETAAGAGQVLVEPVDEKAAERDARDDPDAHAGHGKQDEDAGDQSGPQGPTGQPTSCGHVADFMTYPTPRTVWMSGS